MPLVLDLLLVIWLIYMAGAIMWHVYWPQKLYRKVRWWYLRRKVRERRELQAWVDSFFEGIVLMHYDAPARWMDRMVGDLKEGARYDR